MYYYYNLPSLLIQYHYQAIIRQEKAPKEHIIAARKIYYLSSLDQMDYSGNTEVASKQYAELLETDASKNEDELFKFTTKVFDYILVRML
jgi:hypothetical protein